MMQASLAIILVYPQVLGSLNHQGAF